VIIRRPNRDFGNRNADAIACDGIPGGGGGDELVFARRGADVVPVDGNGIREKRQGGNCEGE
jgi:hypothetical protein